MGTAFVTLFVLLVVNNWYIIAHAFTEISGTGWARLYFVINYLVGVAVLVNLITGQLITGVVEKLSVSVDEREQKEEGIHQPFPLGVVGPMLEPEERKEQAVVGHEVVVPRLE
ncbi:unnamed protein product [Chrysoparadoxa australica]